MVDISKLPNTKVTASALIGAFLTVAISECNRHGVTIDGDEAGAIILLGTTLAGYFTPHHQAGEEKNVSQPNS